MNLRAEILPELWEAVSKPYESGLYKNAILNAIHYLTDVLRERADESGDGTKLVNQALAGVAPKLKLNRLRTDSEKDEQEGLKLMLLGLYQGIRNPRSHEPIEDSKDTAEAVIIFINYIVGLINKAKPSFTIEGWGNLVIDERFVSTREYMDTLVSEVPPSKHLSALIYLFEARNKAARRSHVKHIVQLLFDLMKTDQQDEFLAIVSNELRVVSTNNEIIEVLQILPAPIWPRVERIARLRIENGLIKSIDSGTYYEPSDECNQEGILGTWSIDFIRHFDSSHKHKLSTLLREKFTRSRDDIAYIARFLFWELPRVAHEGYSKYYTERCIAAICEAIENFPSVSILKKNISSVRFFSFEWKDAIYEKLKLENPSIYKELVGDEPTDEDIPF